jgi:hypothetical protein
MPYGRGLNILVPWYLERSLLPSTLLEKNPLKVLNIFKKATSTALYIKYIKNIMCATRKKERLEGGGRAWMTITVCGLSHSFLDKVVQTVMEAKPY